MPKPDPGTTPALAALAALACGCTVYATSSTSASSGTTSVQTQDQGSGATQSSAQTQSGGVRAQGSTLGEGVTIVETTCSAGESCNGLDDDCDGVIDEGCGYGTGAIQVTLGWGTGADLDLYVTDPRGEVLSYQSTRTSSGGVLDQDARGACDPGQGANTTENVFWDERSSPPSGTYRVEVNYWGGECSARNGATSANLSIAVDGRVLGAYAVRLQPGQRLPVANFTLR